MRKHQLKTFLSLLLVTAAAAAQTAGRLDRVDVVRDKDDIRIEMRSSGAVTPKLSTLDTPARVVVDLPGTVMATGQRHIAVGADGVKGLRIGTDGLTPPTTRIVVDLDQACAYDLTPGPAGKLVLTLHAKDVAEAAQAPVVKAPAPTTPVAATKPATKDSVAAKDAAAPNNFVFVEPSYQAKNDANDATAPADAKNVAKPESTDEPAARAQEAAARFSDKTAVELLPVSAHAAQAQSQSQPTPAVNLAAEQKAQSGQAPVSVGPKYTGEPISVNLKDVDLKDFFRLIHEISGLNVVHDPN
ncbi:MAG: AMIN domain-containing protein, partial [Candidatus Sulfotelmatobacter sp.]